MVGETFDSGQVFTEAVDDFTALFYSDRVFIGAREYPIGQCVVDILNLEESELFRIDQILMEFFHTVQEVWEQDTEKSVLRAQKKLQDVWNLVSVLPVYRDLKLFPRRREVPKTLIFAKTDSHADDIVQIVREEFGEGNEFCQKITYSAQDPEGTLSSFRNSYQVFGDKYEEILWEMNRELVA